MPLYEPPARPRYTPHMPGHERLVLEGRFVRLEPLSEAHIDPLVAAASEDRSNYQWSTAPNGRAQTERYVADAMAKVARGEQVAFATVRKGGGSPDRVVGSTRFYEVAQWRWPDGSPHQRDGVPDVVDIGYTWLAASAQRSPVNTEAKLLMLGHAFEVWQVHRVGFQTDERNTRSRKAIERIGGRLDGLLRADQPGTDDTVRTSARFSILASEWPEVKERLTSRLGRGAQPVGD
jgi:N-acetyltransferase